MHDLLALELEHSQPCGVLTTLEPTRRMNLQPPKHLFYEGFEGLCSDHAISP
jgi:hypothetical protein